MALCLYKTAQDFKNSILFVLRDYFANAIIMVIWCFLLNKNSRVYFLQVKKLGQKYFNFSIL